MRDKLSDMAGILSGYSKDKDAAQIRSQRLQELTLQKHEIKLNAVIGKGGFSTVYLGVFHNKQCAIKVVQKPSGGRLNLVEKEAVENELVMTKYLADPNILH